MASQKKSDDNVMKILENAKLMDTNRKDVKIADIKLDFLGLYFSAHWCPPCRGFTPVLAEFYKKASLMQQEKKLEIVFVSSDRDEGAFDDYFKEMPWMALKFEERETKEKLAKKYGISGIPTLVILDKEGELITKDGRNGVASSKDGIIPW